MPKKIILLCAVAFGGPVFDAKGKQTGTNEELKQPGSEVELDDADADRLVAMGAARLPVNEAPVAPVVTTGGDGQGAGGEGTAQQ